MAFNLLVAGTRDPIQANSIVLNGFEINVVTHKCEAGPLPVAANTIDALIGNSIFLHHKIEEFTRLKFVHLTSAGWDRYPLLTAQLMGIVSHNAGDVYSVPMAEWAVGKTFELFKKSRIDWFNQETREWKKQRELPELSGKTVAIFGIGNMGAAVARRFRALEMKVLGVSRRGRFYDDHFDEIVGVDEEERALRTADVVVCCLPLEPSTSARFGPRQFSLMKQSAFFLNASRGGVVDEPALVDSLQRGVIAGAALDVFIKEPLNTSSPLWTMDNVLVTPHQSFESDQNLARLRTRIMDNLQIFLDRKGGRQR